MDTKPDLATYIVYAVDPGEYGPGAGRCHYNGHDLSCGRCSARYCLTACYAGEPGYAYATGLGWAPYAECYRYAVERAREGIETRIDLTPWSHDPPESYPLTDPNPG